MPQLTTLTKIRIARVLSKIVTTARRLRGKEPRDQFIRKGIHWELDLEEVIDLAIYLLGRFEPELHKVYEHHLSTGAVVFDIGANVGAHTLQFAALVGEKGRVYAFEPTDFAVNKLERNLQLNPDLASRVQVSQQLLVGSEDETIPELIPSSWNLKSQEGAHPQHGGSFMATSGATSITLDAFVESINPPKIDLIKIDVDGNEWSVMQGARKSIGTHHPILLMEFAPDYDPESFEQILAALADFGYQAFSLDEKTEYALNLNKLRREIPKNGSINVILKTLSAVV